MPNRFDPTAEWLEADGMGGFASGTVSGRRTRRYHAILLAAKTPPTGRVVLINGFEAHVDAAGAVCPISTQYYNPGLVHSNGDRRLESFEPEPWPCWVWRLENGVVLEQQLFVSHGHAAVALRWRLLDHVAGPAAGPIYLNVRPLLSGRDYHSLHRENSSFRFHAEVDNGRVRFRPYDGVPQITILCNAVYQHAPVWYRDFLYGEERNRGLDCTEDLAAPGVFRWNLADQTAVWIAAAGDLPHSLPPSNNSASVIYDRLRAREKRRRGEFPTPLHRAADAYIVRRGPGRTIVAGYPWFTDWGRDTFIALRGLCVATGRLDVAREILLAWAGSVSEGMLPNRFPDHGDSPEYNSVDASLWYIIAVHDYLEAMAARGETVSASDSQSFTTAVHAILDGYVRGTRFCIHVDEDGLLAAGVPGVQLTWMDAKVGDWVVTPRIGKPVEVQALWLNALSVGHKLVPESSRWSKLYQRGRKSFTGRFWNDAAGCLYDVVDVEHQPGHVDSSLRPNQVFAVGGLPIALLRGQRAHRVVDVVERKLWTPLGLRSLSPDDPAYQSHYAGDMRHRDGAYHQGTVWPWLIGPFVEAWLRVRDGTPDAKEEASGRFVVPLLQHLNSAGIGHVSEIADGAPPHTPRGCPFQAWSLGELLSVTHDVLGKSNSATQQEARHIAANAATGAGSTI